MNPNVFREYDIRGVVERDFARDDLPLLGRAIGTYLVRRGCRTVSLGRDCRLSSPRLHEAIRGALVASGLDVVDISIVPTPLLYFSIPHLGVDGGVMITGSHNPSEYNGFKICVGSSSIHGPEIQEIRALADRRDFASGDGSARSADVIAAYQETVCRDIRLARTDFTVVVDAGNGTAGPVAIPLLRALGVPVVPLFEEMDGRFPNHHPDPTDEKNLEALQATVRREKAEMGIAYDGDADRLGVVDEQGDVLWGDRLLTLFAREILKARPGAAVIAEVKCSQTFFDDVAARGGRPILWKTGHSLIKAKMKEEGAVLAGEMSGHLFFADRYFGYDDAIYASVRLIEIFASERKPLSHFLADVPRTHVTPEIRQECPDEHKFGVVAHVAAHFRQTARVIDVDGARVLFEGGWGLVRASNTQPVLVLRFEANTAARLDAIRSEVEAAVQRAMDAVARVRS